LPRSSTPLDAGRAPSPSTSTPASPQPTASRNWPSITGSTAPPAPCPASSLPVSPASRIPPS
jgi:hypothetical protein